MSASGIVFRTWRGVRSKPVVRNKADVTRLRDVRDVPDDLSALWRSMLRRWRDQS
jgi:hypothetical protein